LNEKKKLTLVQMRYQTDTCVLQNHKDNTDAIY